MRSATSRTVAWRLDDARGSRGRARRAARVSTHTGSRSARRIRWVIETGASSRAAEHRGHARGVVLVDEVGERAPEQRLGLEPEQVAAGGRRVADGAVRLEHADQVGGGLGQHARARLGLEPGELGAVALGAAHGDERRARRARAAATASRRRRSGSSAGRRPAAWRARGPGAPRAARRRRSRRGRRAARASRSGVRAARRRAVALGERDPRAGRQVGADRGADAGTENVARKAPDGAGAGRAHGHGHGDAAAASRRRRAARRWSACRRCGSRPAARCGRRTAGRRRASGRPCRASSSRRS